jgi:hypothetical protein
MGHQREHRVNLTFKVNHLRETSDFDRSGEVPMSTYTIPTAAIVNAATLPRDAWEADSSLGWPRAAAS